MLIDAHLDLSYNALDRGVNVLVPASEQVADAEGIPTVGLPDLRAGGVGLICATLFMSPFNEAEPSRAGYRTAQQAFDQCQHHLAWYRKQVADGQLRLITRGKELENLFPPDVESPAIPVILLMEGADSIRSPEDVAMYFQTGIRAVGLAWKRTRYAGGTGAPGPLTSDGRQLVIALDTAGMIHDASHLAEESFWDLLRLSDGPVMASHSNCRAIVPTDRQLSDEMIRAIVQRDGVIGINFFDRFLLPPRELHQRRARLADVVRHIRHICDIAGDTHHVGIGTDMDGGLGQNEIPEEIRSSADLPKVGDALQTSGFNLEEMGAILRGNWLRFFQRHLP